VIVPGLEALIEVPGWRPGTRAPRATALMARARTEA